MGYKGSNWTRGELGHESPTKEEVAGDLVKDYRDDNRSLKELQQKLSELKEQVSQEKTEIRVRREVAEDIIKDIKSLSDEAEKLARDNAYDKEQGYKHAINRLLHDIQGRYLRTPDIPNAKMKEISDLNSLIIGGKIVEEDADPEEVL